MKTGISTGASEDSSVGLEGTKLEGFTACTSSKRWACSNSLVEGVDRIRNQLRDQKLDLVHVVSKQSQSKLVKNSILISYL